MDDLHLTIIQSMDFRSTREQVLEFHTAFGRPVRDKLTELTLEERLLRGRLLLEEVIETLTKGLGLQLCYGPLRSGVTVASMQLNKFDLRADPNREYDPIETADGLGDINVIIHGTAITMGINLDAVTTEIHASNMSKLDENGQPIINYCRECMSETCADPSRSGLWDPSQPIGKILKGPNYRKPDIAKVIGLAK